MSEAVARNQRGAAAWSRRAATISGSVLRLAGYVHLLGAFGRQAQRHFGGFLRTDDDVLAPIGELAFGVGA